MRLLLAVGWLVAACGFAAGVRADGEHVKEGGGVVMPMSSDEVTMLWETVDLEVERPHLLARDDSVRVTVTYRFKNETARPVQVTMGFPIAWDGRTAFNQTKNRTTRHDSSSISEFTTTVDGQLTAVRERTAAAARSGVKASGRPASRRPSEYQVWDVAFAPGQERTIVNRYRHDARVGVHYSANEIVYILTTGRSWKGPIGRATIRVLLHDIGCVHAPGETGCMQERADTFESDPFVFPRELPEDNKYRPELNLLEGAKLVYHPDRTLEVRWELTSFEPTRDVRLGYQTALGAREQIRSHIERLELAGAPRSVVERARDALISLYGFRPADAALAARFNKLSYYVVDPTMTLERIRQVDPLLAKLEARLAASVAPPAPQGVPTAPARAIPR